MKIENQITYIVSAIRYWLKYHLRAYIIRTIDDPASKDYKTIRKMPIAEEAEAKRLGPEFISKCILFYFFKHTVGMHIPLESAFKKDRLEDFERYEIIKPPVLSPGSDVFN